MDKSAFFSSFLYLKYNAEIDFKEHLCDNKIIIGILKELTLFLYSAFAQVNLAQLSIKKASPFGKRFYQSGVGGFRTLVQTKDTRAFYMLIL